jgi:hypothetical protein
MLLLRNGKAPRDPLCEWPWLRGWIDFADAIHRGCGGHSAADDQVIVARHCCFLFMSENRASPLTDCE